MARALNDDEVHTEMRKMVAFISQEAMEKAREIRVKADEEFNIEKAKLVRTEAVAIENVFAKKIKQSSIQRKISQSMYINKARLRVLQCQEELLDRLMEEASQRLANISKDTESYRILLKNLILQSLLSLMDDFVSIRCRTEDIVLVKQSLLQASAEYRALTKKDVQVSVDEGRPIPDDQFGGIIALSLQGKITCDNTLKKRLQLLSEIMLPQIRAIVLGLSTNRKFFD